MESLGEKLKSAREQKGYTFDQISRDTNIARRYLEALESEDFALFPGEPYLLGFLRNYGEYLGLNVPDLISSYRTIKIQEQPIPVEQLLMKPSPSPLVRGGIIAGAVAALVIVAAVLLLGRGKADDGAQAIERKPTEYALAEGAMEKRLYSGDSVIVSVANAKYKVSVAKLGSSLTLATPGGDSLFELGQEGAVDLNGDGVSDLRVFVADLFKNDPTKGVSLRLEILEGAAAAGVVSSGSPDAAPSESPSESSPSGSAAETPATEAPASAAVAGPVIFSSPNPYPFTLQATFKGFCMFRWESDRKDREEKYFHKAEILNIQAQNGIRLWLSNAGAVKLVAIGGGKTVDIELGGAGEVVVVDVKWVKDEDGRFKLTTVRLD
jgi:cytoskeletal protein RodZ